MTITEVIELAKERAVLHVRIGRLRETLRSLARTDPQEARELSEELDTVEQRFNELERLLNAYNPVAKNRRR